MHPGSPAEPVLAAWGITTGGKPVFVGLAPGAGKSAGAWHDFLQDLTDRTRRRIKVIGRLPGETSCLTLVWAVPGRASRGWRGLTMTSDGLRLLQDLRRSLPEPPRQLRSRSAATSRDDDRAGNVTAVA
jgi:transposase-like protein